jgi:hypothetical protein
LRNRFAPSGCIRYYSHVGLVVDYHCHTLPHQRMIVNAEYSDAPARRNVMPRP